MCFIIFIKMGSLKATETMIFSCDGNFVHIYSDAEIRVDIFLAGLLLAYERRETRVVNDIVSY